MWPLSSRRRRAEGVPVERSDGAASLLSKSPKHIWPRHVGGYMVLWALVLLDSWQRMVHGRGRSPQALGGSLGLRLLAESYCYEMLGYGSFESRLQYNQLGSHCVIDCIWMLVNGIHAQKLVYCELVRCVHPASLTIGLYIYLVLCAIFPHSFS